MEKYGVVLDNNVVEKTKTAGVCPICKSPVSSPHCSRCGSAPFEKKKDSENKDVK